MHAENIFCFCFPKGGESDYDSADSARFEHIRSICIWVTSHTNHTSAISFISFGNKANSEDKKTSKGRHTPSKSANFGAHDNFGNSRRDTVFS